MIFIISCSEKFYNSGKGYTEEWYGQKCSDKKNDYVATSHQEKSE
jgi:hypothetical protein